MKGKSEIYALSQVKDDRGSTPDSGMETDEVLSDEFPSLGDCDNSIGKTCNYEQY